MKLITKRARKVAKMLCNHEALIFRRTSTRQGNQWVESFVQVDRCPAKFYTETRSTREKSTVVNSKEDYTPPFKALILSDKAEAGDRVVPVIDKWIGGAKEYLLFEVSNQPINPAFSGAHYELPLAQLASTFIIENVGGKTFLVMKG